MTPTKDATNGPHMTAILYFVVLAAWLLRKPKTRFYRLSVPTAFSHLFHSLLLPSPFRSCALLRGGIATSATFPW